MNKNFPFCALLSALFLFATHLAADDLPKPLSFARYETILNHSPFAVATAVAAPAALPAFAKDLFVANAAHSADGDLVTLASSTDNNFKKYLTTKTPVDGYGIANIEWSERVGETKVTISKDGEFATLSFNQALLSQPMAQGTAINNNPVVNPIAPGAQQPMNQIRPAPIPMLPTPPPHVRGVISRNPRKYNHLQSAPTVSPQPLDDSE